jgi:hypothetical protein
MGGCGVFCGVEHHVVDGAHEPTTLGLYCLNKYQSCPTWREARDAEIANRSHQFLNQLRAEPDA